MDDRPPRDERGQSRGVMGELTLLATRTNGHVQRHFRPIDPDHHRLWLPHRFSLISAAHRPALARYGLRPVTGPGNCSGS